MKLTLLLAWYCVLLDFGYSFEVEESATQIEYTSDYVIHIQTDVDEKELCKLNRRFLSLAFSIGNLNKTFTGYDIDSIKLKNLLRALSPSYVRIGGTKANFVNFQLRNLPAHQTLDLPATVAPTATSTRKHNSMSLKIPDIELSPLSEEQAATTKVPNNYKSPKLKPTKKPVTSFLSTTTIKPTAAPTNSKSVPDDLPNDLHEIDSDIDSEKSSDDNETDMQVNNKEVNEEVQLPSISDDTHSPPDEPNKAEPIENFKKRKEKKKKKKGKDFTGNTVDKLKAKKTKAKKQKSSKDRLKLDTMSDDDDDGIIKTADEKNTDLQKNKKVNEEVQLPSIPDDTHPPPNEPNKTEPIENPKKSKKKKKKKNAKDFTGNTDEKLKVQKTKPKKQKSPKDEPKLDLLSDGDDWSLKAGDKDTPTNDDSSKEKEKVKSSEGGLLEGENLDGQNEKSQKNNGKNNVNSDSILNDDYWGKELKKQKQKQNKNKNNNEFDDANDGTTPKISESAHSKKPAGNENYQPDGEMSKEEKNNTNKEKTAAEHESTITSDSLSESDNNNQSLDDTSKGKLKINLPHKNNKSIGNQTVSEENDESNSESQDPSQSPTDDEIKKEESANDNDEKLSDSLEAKLPTGEQTSTESKQKTKLKHKLNHEINIKEREKHQKQRKRKKKSESKFGDGQQSSSSEAEKTLNASSMEIDSKNKTDSSSLDKQIKTKKDDKKNNKNESLLDDSSSNTSQKPQTHDEDEDHLLKSTGSENTLASGSDLSTRLTTKKRKKHRRRKKKLQLLEVADLPSLPTTSSPTTLTSTSSLTPTSTSTPTPIPTTQQTPINIVMPTFNVNLGNMNAMPPISYPNGFSMRYTRQVDETREVIAMLKRRIEEKPKKSKHSKTKDKQKRIKDILMNKKLPVEEKERLFKEFKKEKFRGFQPFNMTADLFDDLYCLFKTETKNDIIFDVNAFSRTSTGWDPTNAIELMDYVKQKKYKIHWQLGNEPNHYRKFGDDKALTGSEVGLDYVDFAKLLSTRKYGKPYIIGPDTTRPLNDGKVETYLMNFLSEAKDSINALSWHQYYANGRTVQVEDFLKPSVLNEFDEQCQKMVSLTNMVGYKKPLWITETGSAWGGGAPGISDRYVAGFPYLDKLGIAAKYCVKVVARQTFLSGSYAMVDKETYRPHPDYYLAVLFKRLVGRIVLKTSFSPLKKKYEGDQRFRVYAHCTRKSPDHTPGSLTVYALNLHKLSKKFSFKGYELNKVEQFILTADSLQADTVELNGKPLEMNGDELPAMEGKIVDQPVTIPPRSFGFFVIDTAVATVCT